MALEKTSLRTPPTTDERAVDLDSRIETYMMRLNPTEAEFDELARELFVYQYENNAPYRNLCDQQRSTPANVTAWRDVPALSAASFGDARIACFPQGRTSVAFVSSGTTRAGSSSSIHELENTRLYDASLLAHFRRCVLPDLDRIRMVLLSPPVAQAPQSSLAYMLSKLYASYGSGGGFFIRDDRLDAEGVTRAVRASDEPLLLFGTAFAFVHFLDHCAATGLHFSLPRGSRIVETGGFKGKSRSVDREALYDLLSQTFGVSRDMCIAEYGMCELGSQWYDASLSDALAGRTPREQIKVGPHWVRTLVVDPVTARELAPGSTGLLQVFDLSNRGSVAAVLTGDLVVQAEGGFVYVGRSHAAPPKGCSITVDTMLNARD
jgi:hypothetical protein